MFINRYINGNFVYNVAMGIKSWTDYFLDMAKTCSSRSNCLRAQVGAIIVGQDRKIKATGYNGTPSGVESCYERGECYRIKNNIPSGTVMKPAAQSMQSRMLLYKPVRTDAWVLQCTFTGIILSAFCAKDLLFSPELLMFTSKKMIMPKLSMFRLRI